VYPGQNSSFIFQLVDMFNNSLPNFHLSELGISLYSSLHSNSDNDDDDASSVDVQVLFFSPPLREALSCPLILLEHSFSFLFS
jgi:hypothetical protein